MSKHKTVLKLTESEFKGLLSGLIKEAMEEGIYGYPDTVDSLILMAENDREFMGMYDQIARMLLKKVSNGISLDPEVLANSSMMKKLQQWAFRKFSSEQPDLDRRVSPGLFRKYMAEKMVDSVMNGQFGELNEDFGSYVMSRPNSSKLLSMIDNGLVDCCDLAISLMDFMDDDSVGEFMKANGYVEEED